MEAALGDERATGRGDGLELRDRRETQVDAGLDRGREVGVRIVQPGEDGGRDPGIPEFQSLCQIGDPEPVGAAPESCARAFDGPVPVRVCLHHRHDMLGADHLAKVSDIA